MIVYGRKNSVTGLAPVSSFASACPVNLDCLSAVLSRFLRLLGLLVSLVRQISVKGINPYTPRRLDISP